MSFEDRIKDFGDNLEKLKVHQRRLSALCAKKAVLSEPDLAEMEGTVIVVEQLTVSIGVTYLGKEPADGKPRPCVFSTIEKKSETAFQRLAKAFQQLEATCVETCSKAHKILQLGGSVPAAVQSNSGSSREPKGKTRAGKVQVTKQEDSNRNRSESDPEMQEQALRERDLDSILEAEKRAEIQAIAKEAEELRELRQEMDRLVAEQGEDIDKIEDNTDTANIKVEKGRNQLLSASKMKMAGAWVGGALLGGIVGGPVGMLAGAKSAGAIVGCAVAGSVATGAGAKVVSDKVHKHNSDFDPVPDSEELADKKEQ